MNVWDIVRLVGVVVIVSSVIAIALSLAGCENDRVDVFGPDPVVIEKPVPGPEVPVPQHVRLDVAVRCAVTTDWSIVTGEPVQIFVSDTLCIPRPKPDTVPGDTVRVVVPGPVRWKHCYRVELGGGAFAWRQADGSACPAP